MTILDRAILGRFCVNFVMLFALLFVFGISVDSILNLDKFIDAAKRWSGPDSSWVRQAYEFAAVFLDFQGPRVFQFYAYMHGLVAVGAMGFTLAQMHRHRELVAVMASGVSLHRVAMPFIAAMFFLSLLQLLNQELLLPRVAPLLLRDHGQVGVRRLDSFEVRFTPDGKGNLLQAPQFHPHSSTLTWPTFLERDERGRTARRITARSAVWSDQDRAWRLTGGEAIERPPFDPLQGETAQPPQAVTLYPSDITPQVLLVRRYNEFAAMLSLNQIAQMLEAPRVANREALLRHRYSRFSSILVNLLVMGLALPCFLLREPANLLRQSVVAAGLSVPATVGSAIGMMAPLPGIPPAAGVFLPVIVLLFMSLFPWTFLKT